MRAFQILVDRRPLRAAPRAFSALHGVVDVLVDGANVTARIGQDHALPLLRDLAYAATELAALRQHRVTVRFYDQRDAWALGLERVGDQVLITVFQAGPSPRVAVHERVVHGEAFLRGIGQALDSVLVTPEAFEQADLSAARRMLEGKSWLASESPELIEVRVDGPSDTPLAFSSAFVTRVRSDELTNPPDVDRNDLHSLLVRGSLRIRVGDTIREMGETFPFLVAESLAEQASAVLAAWEERRVLSQRVEAAGVFVCVRLNADGNLSLSIGGPKTAGLRRAPTFPEVSVPSFVEAVTSFGRGLTRPLIRRDRCQHHNLRMQAFRAALRQLTTTLRDAVREDAKYNADPESYRAFADAIPPAKKPTARWNHGRIRYKATWQASVPGIDLHSTFMFPDRIVVGGARELACIDKKCGRLLWRTPIERGISMAAPGAVIRLGLDGSLRLHDVDNGEPSLAVRLAPRVGGGPAGTVIHAPGLPRLIVVSEGERYITAVDLISGEVRWRHRLGRGRFFKVRRAGRLLVVSSSDSTLTALDVASGETVWRVRDRNRFCRPASYDRDSLFVVTGDGAPITRGAETLHVLDPWTGLLRWKQDLPEGRRAVGSPLPAKDVVVVAVHDRRGTGFLAMDRKDGTRRWMLDPGFAPATSAWLMFDGSLIVSGEHGVVSSIDLCDGAPRWRRQFERSLDGDVPRHLDPVLRSGALFLAQRQVNVVRPHDGEPLGIVPSDLVPDLIRVDERCNVVLVEESGHLAAFTAGARLTLVKG